MQPADLHDPYDELLSYGRSVTLSIEPTPGARPAWWCPRSRHILMAPGLSQTERRCHLAHELAHIQLGHESECDEKGSRRTAARERAADVLAAEKLIKLGHFIEALVWSDDNDEVAEYLWVTTHMLDVRIEAMYGGERHKIALALRERRALGE